MASSSSYRLRGSTSAYTSVQWKYDVFLSFRGEDTRQKFTDHLYEKLEWRGIKTFRDDQDLERGTSISPELLAAIEQSRFAVVVLSPNYASSEWCLLELAKIVQCMGDRGTIVPVFYEVDPSDVRHQTGSFAEAFAEHQDKFGEDSNKVQEWRDALTKVANLAGWDSKHYKYETKLITGIVEALWQKVYPTFASSESKEHLVGIDSKLMEIDFLLDIKANDVCFLGIWGMGGIGKTTLARLIYHRISYHFEVGVFLPDVRQLSATHGLVHVQENLLCQILKEKSIQVMDVDDGITRAKRCFSNKRILLVIDDVDQLDQLEKLAGEKDWFGSGSIIIVTTRDQHLLDVHGIVKQYKSRGLNEHEALQLFSWKAFKKDKPEEGYRELSDSILKYAKGVPLALKILGSSLKGRDRGYWLSTVAKLKKAPIDQELFEVLRISYDGLDEWSQEVFLDVACFLKGHDKEQVIKILQNVFASDPRVMIDKLIEKSLITILDNTVNMHDLIQEMGRHIVHLESKNRPGQRSRLWLRDDVFGVLKHNTGTETIRSIALCLPKVEELAWNISKAFHMMSGLKFLKIQNLVSLQGPECLPDEIRVLEWTFYPSKSLPPDFKPMDLLELTLHHSKINRLWHETDERKNLEKLTIIDLSYSDNLMMTPDFEGIPNLETLILEGCTNLVNIHPSTTSLKRLKVLNCKNCRSIEKLPDELEMDSLEMIDFSGCSKVSIFPRFVSRMENLSELSFGGIRMQTCEVSRRSISPHRLSLVLASLKHLCSLKRLYLNDCELGEGDIPDDIGCLSSLEELDLSVNNFVSLPASISKLSKLKCLNLADCKRLQQMPDLPLFNDINGTCHLTADNCISLKRIPDLPEELCRLWKVSFNFVNCCSIGEVDDDGNESVEGYCSTVPIIYPMLKWFVQEPPPFFEMFSILIPGNVVPWWFKNQTARASVTVDCMCTTREWIGYALCVLFGAEQNLGVLSDARGMNHYANMISCRWKPSAVEPSSCSLDINQVVKADHLCLFLLPKKYYYTHGKNSSFRFEIICPEESNTLLKVKGCGVRPLYKHDVTELHTRMNRHKRIPERTLTLRMLNQPEKPLRRLSILRRRLRRVFWGQG